MKLEDKRPNVESSVIEEQMFSIENPGMMFDILRDKMYSNKIAAICREISCNARDAHREVGNPNPIEIHLPNALNPVFSIKDYGPGISPDRMLNVFIKYTASTKRNDNVQTGGFGLGAKTPFAYSDTFSIATCVNGIKYNYVCFIDETKVGKLSLLNEEKTSESNGTEISIVVNPKDFNSFRDEVVIATQHWDIKPIVKGNEISWKPIEILLEGNNWKIIKKDYYSSCKAIVDGIEYDINLSKLDNAVAKSLSNSLSSTLFLYFGIGELNISASREQLYFDDKTNNCIIDKLNIVLQEIKSSIIKKINAFDNLWDASLFFKDACADIFYNSKILGAICWQGIELIKYDFLVEKTNIVTIERSLKNENRFKKREIHTVIFKKSNKLLINDLNFTADQIAPKQFHAVFEDKNINMVQIIVSTSADLNKLINLDKLKTEKLSSLVTKPARKISNKRNFILFKFNSLENFIQVTKKDWNENNNHKVVAQIRKFSDKKKMVLLNDNKLSGDLIASICQHFKVDYLYGIDESVTANQAKEQLGDYIDLESFLKEQLANFDAIKAKVQLNMRYHCYGNHYYGNKIAKKLLDLYLDKIENKDSPIIKEFEIIRELSDDRDYSLLSHLVTVYSYLYKIDEQKVNDFFNNYNTKYWHQLTIERYPLLSRIEYHYEDNNYEDIIDYINLIDRKLNDKN